MDVVAWLGTPLVSPPVFMGGCNNLVVDNLENTQQTSILIWLSKVLASEYAWPFEALWFTLSDLHMFQLSCLPVGAVIWSVEALKNHLVHLKQVLSDLHSFLVPV